MLCGRNTHEIFRNIKARTSALPQPLILLTVLICSITEACAEHQQSTKMEQPVVNDSWSDQVNDLGTCKNGANMNKSRTEATTAYAIKWGEKIEVSALSLLLAVLL